MGEASLAGANRASRPAPTFGTAAVFWTTLSTILGAILFLRMGYAIAQVGLVGALMIVALGHLVTLPTSMAIAEISTNQRLAAGGVYYVLSRSFGLVVGGAIGISLYLSQAISIAFYVIAFAEAFRPLLDRVAWLPNDPRVVSVPALLALAGLLRMRGAQIGLAALYVVAATLLVSIALFLAGPNQRHLDFQLATETIAGADPFFRVFAIVFPAFTGLTAGVGLSGDLRDPKRSIPLGTLAAVATGLAVYCVVTIKLAVSATPIELATDPLVMSKIAIWGPIIPIGLACATFSSALGSALAAPRTLQALAVDGAFPVGSARGWLKQARASDNEPLNAAAVTTAIALVFVLAGDVDSVAQIITMFFLVTYGAICLVSILEGVAGDPTYRPSFRSRSWLSLLGAVLAFAFMFGISPGYAIAALALLGGLFAWLRIALRDRVEPVDLFQGVFFQISLWLQLRMQRSVRGRERVSWRPAVVCLSDATFERTGAFDLMRWIAYRHGFATYIHFLKGYLSKSTHEEAGATLERLVRIVDTSRSNIYVDTMVSPSFTSAFTQLIQLPGISGKANNLVLFECDKARPEDFDRVLEHLQLAAATGFDSAILGLSPRGFGYHHIIHLWLAPGDYDSANLLILLAYVIASHPDWRGAEIAMFEIVSREEQEQRRQELRERVRSGRLPIAERNVEAIVLEPGEDRRAIVARRSRDADLTMIAVRREALRRNGNEILRGYDGIGNVLFVSSVLEIDIERSDAIAEANAGAEGGVARASNSSGAAKGQTDAPATDPAKHAEPDEVE